MRQAVSVTIAGEPGRGKTTFAATFPNPLFIRVEDGTRSILHTDAHVTPLIQNSKQVMGFLDRLLKEEHDRKTVVIDTVSALDLMMEQEICRAEGVSNIVNAGGGWGKGGRILADKIGQIRKAAQKLVDKKGMFAVFLAQSLIRTVRPENAEAYDQLGLKMNDRSCVHFQDDVDVIGFLKLKIERQKVDDGRRVALSSGARELWCVATPYNTAKNRIGIKEVLECPMGDNPILTHIQKETENAG